MEREMGLKWLFLDLNSYFASVEQQERPELRGKPVAVVPMNTDSTCAIAASYEAKAYGVKTGTKIYEAKKMCPGLQCVQARHDKYVEYHHKIINEIIRHTPINKIWSIDELSSRLPPNKRSKTKAKELALRIKHGIWNNVGEAISCSIGIAPNSLLAKIAGEIHKPDGLFILPQEDLPGPLLDLKLTDIPGIGDNMERRLLQAHITSMEKLWNTSPKHARRVWGSVLGERMWYWLHGYDFDTPETGNVMIGHSRVLDPNLRHPSKAKAMARRLLTKATYRLRRKGFYAARLHLRVRSINAHNWQGERRFSPAKDPFTFLSQLDDLWDSMMALYEHETVRFKKISVVLSDLKMPADINEDLFEYSSKKKQKTLDKREALAGALDYLQTKYRKETVWLGCVPKTLSGHVGTKIAFSRVPEQEEFWN